MAGKVTHIEDKAMNDLLREIAEQHMLTWKDVWNANKAFKNKKMIMHLPVPVVIGDDTYNAMCLMNMSDDPNQPLVIPQLVKWTKDKIELCFDGNVKNILIQEATIKN